MRGWAEIQPNFTFSSVTQCVNFSMMSINSTFLCYSSTLRLHGNIDIRIYTFNISMWKQRGS